MKMKKRKGRKKLVAALMLTLVGMIITTFVGYHLYTVEVPKTVREVLDRGLEDVVADVMPSVVHVLKVGVSQGSGVFITNDIILTARHLVDNGSNFVITLADGTEVRATQAISSKKYDMGFIKLDDEALDIIRLAEKTLGKPIMKPAVFTSMKGCKLGTSVFVIGSPWGKIHFNSVTLGIISGLRRDLEEFVAREGYPNCGWQITFTTDAAGHPGNSGCPVFTMDGKVRGILVAGFSPVLVHVIPADTVVDDLEQIKILFTMNDYKVEETPARYEYYYNDWMKPENPRLPIWKEPFPTTPYNRSPFRFNK